MEAKQKFEPGEVIFVEGEPGDHLYIIESGEVLLLKEEGQKVAPLAQIGPGGFAGELSAFSKRTTRNLSAVAVEETYAYRVSIEDVKKVLKVCPDWVAEIMQLISERLKISTEVMKEHRITSDEMEKYAETNSQDLLMYQENVERYRQENGLKL